MKLRIARLVSLAMLAGLPAGCSHPSLDPAGFAIEPTVQNPGATNITILWTTVAESPAELRYGHGSTLDVHAPKIDTEKVVHFLPKPKDDLTPPTSATSFVYTATLEGLTPGTTYGYRVTQGTAAVSGSFTTFPDHAGPFTFGVYGDSRSNTNAHRMVVLALAQHNPAFILHSGDLVSTGAFADYQPQFFEPLRGIANRIPILPVAGNHERDAVAFHQLFSQPGNERWFSFDYRNAHIVALDSCATGEDLRQMLAWLEQDLSASAAAWKIVYYHYPTYDIGSHHSKWGRGDVAPICRRHGVDLVIAGHTHTYQRFLPLYAKGENDEHPITYLVVAGGGAPLYEVETNKASAVTASAYHYLLVTVDGDTLSGRALTPDGKVLDEFQIAKPGGKFPPAYLKQAVEETDFDAPNDAARAVPRKERTVEHPNRLTLFKEAVPVSAGPRAFCLGLIADG